MKGDLQEASHIFKKVLTLDQNNTDAMIWLSVSYFLSGRPDAARPISEKLLQVDPLSNISHSTLASIEVFGGNIKESLPYHQRWLQLEPESPFVRFMCMGFRFE